MVSIFCSVQNVCPSLVTESIHGSPKAPIELYNAIAKSACDSVEAGGQTWWIPAGKHIQSQGTKCVPLEFNWSLLSMRTKTATMVDDGKNVFLKNGL